MRLSMRETQIPSLEPPPAEPGRSMSPASQWADSLAMWLTAATLAVMMVPGQWRAYRHILNFGILPSRDALLLQWSLLALILAAMLPLLLLCEGLRRRKHPRLAWGVFVAGQIVLCFYFIVDVHVLQITGHHLAFYLPMIIHPQVDTEIGGLDQFTDALRLIVQWILTRVLLLSFFSYWLCKLLARVGGRRPTLWLGRGAIAIYGATLLALLPCQLAVASPNRLSYFLSSLPVDLSSLAWSATRINPARFDAPLNADLNPKITAQSDNLLTPKPMDQRPLIDRPNPPNVIILVLDSLRRDRLSAQWMPHLTALARQGMNLRNHNAGDNLTHLGLFTLLYGRSALFFSATQDRFPPQLPITFRRSGYKCTLLKGVGIRQCHFLKPGPAFNQVVEVEKGPTDVDWASNDCTILHTIHHSLTVHRVHPQFFFALLSSTHYPYCYTPDHRTYTPALDMRDCDLMNPTPADYKGLFNSYKNAVGFLDEEIARFIQSIDLTRNIVMVTGDHGESFGEDGTIFHAGRLSHIETAVPCFLIGAGVPVRQITDPTQHIDLLPTLLHLVEGKPVSIRHAQGRDILSVNPPAAILLSADSVGKEGAQFVLAHQEHRCRFFISRQTGQVTLLGTADQRGVFLPQAPPPATAPQWAHYLNHCLRTWAR